ncbi:pre-mRNA processing factor 3-domain-containing protein [Vararia minispora EC-137]|uniref:Pre-mRNA processing factor 3-domain-containing protein n=1 Tax=Vararia minispora EC-137 TaxID=1314806 RepID=A0ACB8R070_9AGAM|nr:pre-mRNA processing factor 3-domain-containing protein [Vararia minispora EC-137]
MSKRPPPAESSGPLAKKARKSLSAEALIAQKKAEIAAKLAAFKKSAPGNTSASVSASPAPATHSPSPGPSGSGVSSAAMSDMATRIAEAKKKVAAAQSKVGGNPYMAAAQNKGKSKAPPAEPAPQGAGLKMAAHPLLLDTSTPAPSQSKKDRYKPMQPKFASIRANTRNAPTPPPAVPTPVAVVPQDNPYSAAAAEASATPGGFEGAPRERVGRTLRFNPKGKYVAQAAEIRREQQLEALKKRIADSAKKAGLDSEFDTLERKLKREPPPRAEWWDEGLLPTKNYEDIDNFHPSALNIRKEGSPITIYVQHPIPIPAPGDKNKPGAKPLMLTKKEMKKLRKRRRQAELQDKRDRIRMGLLPPDPPKVRLVNMMKVLTSDAVQDPTRVEARVRREVAQRKHTHEKMNTERKLTEEQRREKVETKKVEEEKKGLHAAIFKVRILTDPAHRFKVRKNAEQMNLTGLLVQNPSFSMVYVEGAAKFIRQYKGLMLRRIAWTEAARARGEEEVELDAGDDGVDPALSKGKEKATEEQDEEVPQSLEDNRCDLVWEGPVRERAFATFRPKLAPTDNAAREVLGQKLAGYWDMTKAFRPEEEQFGI